MQQSLFFLFFGTGDLGTFITVTLLTLSLVCWAIVLEKALSLNRAQGETEKFLEEFQRGGVSPQVFNTATRFTKAPEARLYTFAYNELASLLGKKTETFDPRAAIAESRMPIQDLATMLERYMNGVIPLEMNRLESRLSVLATTAAVSPLIGLFGTVWGILISFRDIATQQSASLATVAPGISQALTTTVAGLTAAIPAVIAYNFFLRRLRRVSVELECFAALFVVRTQGYGK